MAATLPWLGWAASSLAKQPVCYGACRYADGQFGVIALSTKDGSTIFDTPLHARAHDLVLSPDAKHLLCIARRPGRYLIIIDATSGEVLGQQVAASGRHFYGHACFSADGQYLFTTENAYDEARGVIGIRDVNRGYKQIAEWDAQGIGPHQIELSPAGDRLIIAIGGIQTHPDTGRDKLNLDSMQSALVYLDARTGRLIEKHFLPESQRSLSIRHIALADNHLVGMAFQDQDDADSQKPLVGFHQSGHPIKTQIAEARVQHQMKGYCASIAAEASGRWFAVTSPKGNLVTLWEGHSQRCIGTVKFSDCSGVAATGQDGEFIVSNGRGKSLLLNAAKNESGFFIKELQNRNIAWDNHLTTS